MIDTEYNTSPVLADRMEEMTPSRAVALVRQLCVQLGQDAESFHGAICPENIRQDWDGQWVLGAPSDAPVAERNADQVEYVAPEFFWDSIGSAAGDVYSLGMLLYALCEKGYLPFQPKGGALTDKDRSGALRKRMKGEPVTAPSGVSSLLKHILEKTLSYEPENRYLSATALLAALNETDEALPEPEAPVVPVAESPADEGEEAVETAEELMSEDEEPVEAAEVEETVEELMPEAETPEADEETVEAVEEGLIPEETVAADEEPEVGVAEPEEAEDPLPQELEEPAPEEETWPEESQPMEEEPAADYPAAEEVIPEETTEEILPFQSADEEPLEEAPATEGNTDEFPMPEEVPVLESALEEPAVSVLDDDDFWNMPLPEEPVRSAQEKKYTVQKDFEKKRSHAKSTSKAPQQSVHRSTQKSADKTSSKAAASASRRKPASKRKQNNWIVPVLCILAVVVVVGAVYALLTQGGSFGQVVEDNQVSEPFVVTPATEAPEPTEEPEEDVQTPAEDEVEPEDEEQTEEETRRGSATIGDYVVEEADDTVYVNGSGVNLRSGPSTTYPIQETLTRGVALERTGTVNGWSQVQYNGEEYYVSDALVTTTKPDSAAESADTSAATIGTGTSTTTAAATTTTTAANTGTTTAGNGSTTATTTTTTTTATGTGSATTTTASATVTATRDVVVVSKNDCYLRSGPGTGYDHIATLDSGAVLQRTGTVNGWSRVVYQGKALYISDTLIGEEDESTVTTAVGTVKVTGDVNIRSTSSTEGDILGVAKSGESLTVTGLVAGKWYQVSYDGQEGYVNRNYIQVSDFALLGEQSGTVTVQEKANLRSGPSTDYEVLTVADAGESLTVTGLTDSNWYQVSYNDQTGYIAASLVKAD